MKIGDVHCVYLIKMGKGDGTEMLLRGMIADVIVVSP